MHRLETGEGTFLEICNIYEIKCPMFVLFVSIVNVKLLLKADSHSIQSLFKTDLRPTTIAGEKGGPCSEIAPACEDTEDELLAATEVLGIDSNTLRRLKRRRREAADDGGGEAGLLTVDEGRRRRAYQQYADAAAYPGQPQSSNPNYRFPPRRPGGGGGGNRRQQGGGNGGGILGMLPEMPPLFRSACGGGGVCLEFRSRLKPYSFVPSD